MKTKTTAALAAFILIILLFAACAGENDNGAAGNITEQEPNAQNFSDDLEPDTEIKDSLPDGLDFGEAVLNLHVRGDCNIDIGVPEFGVEAEIGEIINDILYRRDKAVEDRLNIKLNVITGLGWQDYNSEVTTIRASIASGDQSYDIIAGWSARIPSLSVEGLLMNLHELPHLKLSEPWWNKSIADEMTINQNLHFAVGDGNLSLLANCMVMFTNNKIQQEYNLPDIYETVFGGGWTIDYMNNLVKDISADLNGDGAMDENDLYGTYIGEYNRFDGFLQASNIKMTKIDEHGIPYLDIEYEKLANLVNMVYELIYNNPGSYVSPNIAEYNNELFKNNQIYIAPGWLLVTNESLRDMEEDYSIIPYPKYDAAQDRYYSRIQDGVSLLCVPVNSTKTELTGAFMEAAASESYKNVSPQYFDVAMKLKYARDETASKMLDIIRDGAYLNFASIYNESINYPWFVMRDLMSTRSNNFASWFDRNEARIASAIENLADRMTS
ncbi:MAG: extracellular solute-binding protein [Oscillospiraceae bacterium]|nr:extracellular solute-binding protein [Oscillospiraceae bacterium]